MTVQLPSSQDRLQAPLRYAKQNLGSAEATRVAALCAELAPLVERLETHPMYGRIQTLDDVRVFMGHHVFAVWDFMLLLKSLQGRLTGTSLPWRPVGDGTTRRLINEIVLEEESGDIGGGRYGSHYELYLEAMTQAGVHHGPVQDLASRWERGVGLEAVVQSAELPPTIEAFLTHTWRVATTLADHSVAAAFAFGREAVLPTLFTRLVASLPVEAGSQLSGLQAYLNLHIELDGEVHNDLSVRMVSLLCGDDERKWHDALVVAQASLEARIALWDGVVADLDRRLN